VPTRSKKKQKKKRKVKDRSLSLIFHHRVLLLLFFFSGFASLVYEVAWSRTLTLVMGGSIYAVSVILATFMGGLALGSFALGRICDRSRNPLLLYSILEFAIGLYGLAVPFMSSHLYSFYIPLAKGLSSHISIISVRALVSFVFLLLPTFLMGGTFPVMIRHLTRNLDRIGSTVGRFYALNTFGGVAGAMGAAIFLIKEFGLTTTVFTAAALNLAVGACALLLSRRPISEDREDVQASSTEPKAAPILNVSQPVLLIAVALTGFSSLGYEVLWTRMLMFVLGNSTWAFSTMLVAFLTGIAIGSMIISRYVDKVKNLILLIILIEMSAAAITLLLIPTYGSMYEVRKWIVETIGTINGLFVALFCVSFLSMILPTTLIGMIFPAISKAYTRSVDTVGKGIGNLYALNTVGAIFGATLPAFLLIPLLGLKGSLIIMAVVNSVAGMILIPQARNILLIKRIPMTFIPVVILVAGFAFVPADLEIRGPIVGYNRIYKHESAGGTIEIFSTKKEMTKTLVLNGVPEVPTDRISLQTFRLLAFLPVLIHPEPKNALVVTFGGGIVTGTLGRYDLESIDCVEIFPEIRKAAPYFREENHDALNNPLVNLVVEDGRNFLLTSDKRYDIITSDATHPSGVDSWVLYTTEYYKLCREHLTPDGLFVQWIPLHHISFDGYCTIIKTIRTAFPHVEIWFTGVNKDYGHTIVLGSKKELTLDYELLANRLREPVINEDLSSFDLDDPLNIISLRLMDLQGIDRMVEGVPVNTDDKPIISFPTILMEHANNLENMNRLIQFRSPTRLSNVPQDDSEKLRNMLIALPNRYRGEVLYYSGQFMNAMKEMHRTLDINPYDDRAYYLLERIERKRAKDRITRITARDARDMNEASLFAKGYIAYSKSNYEEAKDYFQLSIEKNESFPEPYCYMGFTLSKLGERQEAENYFRKALEIWPEMGMAKRGLIVLEENR
jgi:spermidine synthase